MTALTIPILPSPDLDGTERFYARLGFAPAGRWPGEYLILRRPDGIELHFWLDRSVERFTNTASCYIRFPDAMGARRLYDEWAGHVGDEATLTEPTETDYGLLEAALIDPDGNLVRFGGGL